MNYYKEPPKEIPIIEEVDVLVAGGGPAGIAAAIGAARAGAKTMLIERYGCFGGVISQAGVEGFAWYRHPGTVEAGGIAIEFEEEAIGLGGATPEVQSTSQALDAEIFKCVADKMILEAGVIPLLHTYVVDAIVEEEVLKGVIIDGKSGRQAIMAKRIIDCTGDGDVAARAGAPFTKRDPLSCVTPVFNCRGVDKEKFEKYIAEDLKPTYSDWRGEWQMETNGKEDDMFSPYLVAPFRKAIEEGRLDKEDHIDYGGSYSTVTDEGEVLQLNAIFIYGVDCTDARDMTRAEMDGRKAILKAVQALRENVPGFEEARLRNFGMTMGTRESRQIVGLYKLTKEDVMEEARFDDSIGIFPEFIDGNGILWIPTTGRYFHLPLRALIPEKIENLLVAGRAISGDINAHAAFRNMSCCVVTGQGAGVAAAISIQDDVNVKEVDIKKVQQTLEKQNVRVF